MRTSYRCKLLPNTASRWSSRIFTKVLEFSKTSNFFFFIHTGILCVRSFIEVCTDLSRRLQQNERVNACKSPEAPLSTGVQDTPVRASGTSGTGAWWWLVRRRAGHNGHGLTVASIVPSATRSIWKVLLQPWDHLQNEGCSNGLKLGYHPRRPEEYLSTSQLLKVFARGSLQMFT